MHTAAPHAKAGVKLCHWLPCLLMKHLPPLIVLIPSWRALRALGSSRAVGLSVFVPIIGYYILYGEAIAGYFSLDPAIFKQEVDAGGMLGPLVGLPRPHILYFGLVFVALGSIIYYTACPTIIKENESASAYFGANEHQASPFHIDFITQRVLRLRPRRSEYYNEWIENIQRHYGSIFCDNKIIDEQGLLSDDVGRVEDIEATLRLKSRDVDVLERHTKLVLAAVCNIHYSILNRQRILMRALCTGCYSVGFFLIGLASLQVIVEITLSMI